MENNWEIKIKGHNVTLPTPDGVLVFVAGIFRTKDENLMKAALKYAAPYGATLTKSPTPKKPVEKFRIEKEK